MLVRPKIPADKIATTPVLLTDVNLIYHLPRPSGVLSAIVGTSPQISFDLARGGTNLPHFEVPEMEYETHSEQKANPLLPPPFVSYSKQYPSPWRYRFETTAVIVRGERLNRVSRMIFTHKKGDTAAYPPQAQPLGTVELLGLMGSRFALILDEPYAVLFDLKTKKSYRIATADDIALYPEDPERKQPFQIQRRAGVDPEYEWTVKNPDDVVPLPEYRILRTSDQKFRS